MDKAPAISLMVVAGSFIALQAPINGMLGRTVGTFAAASVSFSIGTAALVAITVLVGGGSVTWARRAVSRGTTWRAGCSGRYT